MNLPPDYEKHPSATTGLLQPPTEPTPSMGYGPPPQYPPYYNQPGAGGNQGPPIHHVPLTVIVPEPEPTPSPDFLGYSIFTMLCCCLPLGIAALVFSIQTRQDNHNRDYAAARRNSRKAQTLNHTALGLGIAFIILYIILMVLFFTSVLSVSSRQHYNFQTQFGHNRG
nr:transmembrane protein 91-like [Pogona vitticeps]